MRYTLIIVLLVLAGCTQTSVPVETNDTMNESVVEPDDDTEDPEPPAEEPVAEDPQEPIEADDEAYRLWQETRTGDVAVLLVSDGRQAARLVLPEGRSVLLEMARPVNVSVHAIDADGTVQLRLDDEEAFLQEHGELRADGILAYVTEVIVRT